MKHLLLTTLFIIAGWTLQAQKTIHVVTHKQELVNTDPSTGMKYFPKWGVFPSKNTDVRRILLKVTLGTPLQDSMRCADWDYIDAIWIRKAGGKQGKEYNYEFARMLTPYGGAFRKGWSFQWEIDVTDFALLLRDSVEIDYAHSGYEPGNDRGWAVTVDFEIELGKPLVTPIAIHPLYVGSFRYGDSTRSIENDLVPKTFTFSKESDLAKVYMIQTGHGMDKTDNCSEFCSKYRDIYWDGKFANRTQLWRKCGNNPLYPQAGTWIFDRANWCPGYLVDPDILVFPIQPGTTHTVDMNMEPYVCEKPSAQQSMSTFVMEYKINTTKNDVALRDIKVPSTKDLYGRLNPCSGNPIILVKNNTPEPVYSLQIEYGANGSKNQDRWTGIIQPYQTIEITLSKPFTQKNKDNWFEADIKKVNDQKDVYPADNKLKVPFNPLPLYKGDLIVVLETNNRSHDENDLYIQSGNTKILNHPLGSLDSASVYRDTLHLKSGDYYFHVGDTARDGLDFWFLAEAGTGKCYLTNLKGEILKYFNPDFGASIDYHFRVDNSLKNEILDSITAVNVYPAFTQGKFAVSILSNKKDSLEITITDETKKIIQEIKTTFPKENILKFDISDQKDGRYFIEIKQNKNTYRKRVQKKSDLKD